MVGQYSRGYYLAVQPLRVYLAQTLTNVLFPHLSRIQQDSARLRRAYLSMLMLSGIVVFPVCAGMAVAARELVRVVLGPQWGLAATIVPWFALAGGCSVISALSQMVAEARADLNRSMAVQAAYVVALGVFLLVAVALPLARGVGVCRRRRRRRAPPACRLPGAHAAHRRVHFGRPVGVVRSGCVRQRGRRVRRRRHPCASWSARCRRWWSFAAEVVAGALALALCVRVCPLPAVRRELWLRLTAAGLLGGAGGLRWRLAPLVLGRPQRELEASR